MTAALPESCEFLSAECLYFLLTDTAYDVILLLSQDIRNYILWLKSFFSRFRHNIKGFGD